MESIIEFLNMGIEALNNAGDNFDSFADRATYWGVITYLKGKLLMLEIAYGVASVMLENVGISAFLENAWSQLDSSTLSVFTYLRIPEGLNAIVSAAVTRFVLDLMP